MVFVDDIDEVPAGAPLMLSAHGSPPEVVDAARARGGAVVNAVCPLVQEGPPRGQGPGGKGYAIVYVGHEGHQEAVGTMAVAPDAVHRVETMAEIERLPEPTGPVAFLAQTTLAVDEWQELLERGPGPLARPVGARAPRPVLRHHQPPGRPEGHRRPLRRGGGHRLGQLVEHPGPRAHRPAARAAPGCCGSTGPTSCPTTWPAPSG